MKRTLFLFSAVLAAYAPAALSVKFNVDAMKSMQQEGMRLADQAMTLHPLRLPTGKCLQGDGGVSVADCADKPAQRWRFDDAGRLANEAGRCLAVAGDPAASGTGVTLADCGDSPAQKWRPDANGRVVDGAGKCLNAADPNAAGTPVNIADCGGAPNQVWR